MTLRHHSIWLAVVLALSVPALVACGSDDESSATTATTSAPDDTTSTSTSTASEPESTTTVAEDYPCSLFDRTELGSILGNPLDVGDGVTNHVTENDVTYVGEECSWSATGGTGNELRVQVSEAKDFPDGSIGCPPPIGDAAPVAGVGTSATWDVSAATDTEVGTLRVCAPTAFVVVVVDGPVGVDHQQMAVKVANLGLTALPAG